MTAIREFAQQILAAKTLEVAQALAQEHLKEFRFNVETMPTNGLFKLEDLMAAYDGDNLTGSIHFIEQVRFNGLNLAFSIDVCKGLPDVPMDNDQVEKFMDWFDNQVSADNLEDVNTPINIAQLLIGIIGVNPSDEMLDFMADVEKIRWDFMSPNDQTEIFRSWDIFVKSPESFDLDWELHVEEGLDS